MRVGIAISLLLAGCAANQLRVERANSFSTQAMTTVAAARTFIAGVQTRRRDAAVALVASDPSCLWGPVIIVDRDWNGRGGLCDLRSVPETRRRQLILQPASPEALKAITTAIGGIAAYQEALADILDEKPDDAKEVITTAIDTLTTATGDINRIAGEKIFDLGGLSSDRAKAVVNLIGTLADMQQTNLKVGNVRLLIERTDSAALISALDESAARLSILQDGNSATYRLLGLTVAYGNERTSLRYHDRVARVREIAAATDDVTSGNRERLRTLRGVLTDLTQIDQKLRDALAGRFTPEERHRIARENRKQLFAILTQVASLFPPL